MTIDTLIEVLESATEGSRALDLAIHNTLGAREMLVLNYTTSLDAALLLVPGGQWDGQIMWNFGDIRKGGFVELNLANPQWVDPDCEPSETMVHAACVSSYEDEDPRPRPLALAVCIAALKARRAMGATP